MKNSGHYNVKQFYDQSK